MGIPVAVEVTRHLGLDQYVILHKTPKIHLADAVSETVRSITTDAEQRLLFDRARIQDVANKRVAIVDDVISTGASTGTALRLLRGVGAEIVAIGTLVTEAVASGAAPSARTRGWFARSDRFQSFDLTAPVALSRTGTASSARSPERTRGLRLRVGSSSLASDLSRDVAGQPSRARSTRRRRSTMPASIEKSAPPYQPAVQTPCTTMPAHAAP